jgi:hypothetical protein
MPPSEVDLSDLDAVVELFRTFTVEEFVMVLVVVLPLITLVFALLRESLMCCLRLQCIEDLLKRIEVSAELAAMDGSVRRAVRASSPKPGDSDEPGRAGYRPSPMSRKRNANVASMSHSMITAETKAAASKVDDRGKNKAGLGTTIARVEAPRQASKYASKSSRASVARVDKRGGKATLVYPGDGVYEGEYVDGRKEGRGKFWYVFGSVYASDGMQVLTTAPSSLPHRYVFGSVYEGQWLNDEKHGKGKEMYNDGATYDGRFHEGARHGAGVLTYANRDVYDGEWDMDVKQVLDCHGWPRMATDGHGLPLIATDS